MREHSIDKEVALFIVTIREGVVNPCELKNFYQMQMESLFYPPKRFSSGRSMISKSQISQMVDDQKSMLKNLQSKYDRIFVHVRGSYLSTLKTSSTESGVNIIVLLSEYELSILKRKGIAWMKMGLRMNTSFVIFSRRLLSCIYNKPEQALLPI